MAVLKFQNRISHHLLLFLFFSTISLVSGRPLDEFKKRLGDGIYDADVDDDDDLDDVNTFYEMLNDDDADDGSNDEAESSDRPVPTTTIPRPTTTPTTNPFGTTITNDKPTAIPTAPPAPAPPPIPICSEGLYYDAEVANCTSCATTEIAQSGNCRNSTSVIDCDDATTNIQCTACNDNTGYKLQGTYCTQKIGWNVGNFGQSCDEVCSFPLNKCNVKVTGSLFSAHRLFGALELANHSCSLAISSTKRTGLYSIKTAQNNSICMYKASGGLDCTSTDSRIRPICCCGDDDECGLKPDWEVGAINESCDKTCEKVSGSCQADKMNAINSAEKMADVITLLDVGSNCTDVSGYDTVVDPFISLHGDCYFQSHQKATCNEGDLYGNRVCCCSDDDFACSPDLHAPDDVLLKYVMPSYKHWVVGYYESCNSICKKAGGTCKRKGFVHNAEDINTLVQRFSNGLLSCDRVANNGRLYPGIQEVYTEQGQLENLCFYNSFKFANCRSDPSASKASGYNGINFCCCGEDCDL